jgi:hypothetical protein
MTQKDSAEKAVREIRRKTRRKFSAEEKIRIVLEGLRGEEARSACWAIPSVRRPRAKSPICGRKMLGSRRSWRRRSLRAGCSKKA